MTYNEGGVRNYEIIESVNMHGYILEHCYFQEIVYSCAWGDGICVLNLRDVYSLDFAIITLEIDLLASNKESVNLKEAQFQFSSKEVLNLIQSWIVKVFVIFLLLTWRCGIFAIFPTKKTRS